MSENRINPRYKTLGKARIPGIIEKDLDLINISITGICLKCGEGIDKLKIGGKYTVIVKSKSFFKTYDFEVKTECKWLRARKPVSEIGLSITASPKGRNFQTYVDFITSHTTLD